MVELELVSLKVSHLIKTRMWQDKPALQYVAGRGVVSSNAATIERNEIQSTKPNLVWQLSHAFDRTRGETPYALHEDDVSS